jgi:L-amino acid N-acyltransferase YncA
MPYRGATSVPPWSLRSPKYADPAMTDKVRTRRAATSATYGFGVDIRLADPERDAPVVVAIYRRSVEGGPASFEEVAPHAAEMTRRIRRTLARTPWLVAEDNDGKVVGYAYAGTHHERPGYRWAANISVYVAEAARGQGVGRRLYDELLDILRRQGFVNVYAGITLPNPASVALHEAIGMRRIGVYERVGFKLGAWHDVAWYGLRLSDPVGVPPDPTPLPELRARG